MYNKHFKVSMYSLQLSYCIHTPSSFSNKNHKPSKVVKCKQSESIRYKIKNIKALDRALFNLKMKVNGVFDKDYNVVEKDTHDLDDHTESLNKIVKLRKLKDDWEKELLCTYFMNEQDKE